MTDSGNKRDRWGLVPVATFAVIAAVTWIWLRRDQAFFFWDPFVHISGAADFLADPGAYLSRIEQFYPPLGHMVLAFFYRASGDDLDAAVSFSNLSFFAILLAAVYSIGASLATPRAGAMAAAFLALYPEIFIRLRFPLLDLPLAALVAAAHAALLKSDGFRNRQASVAFGALLGLAQITKHLALPLTIPCLAAALWFADRNRRVALNVAVASALAAGIALPWWLPRLDFYRRSWLPAQFDYAARYSPFPADSTAGLAYYSLGIWYLTSLFFAALWFAAIRSFLTARARPVLLWCAGTFVLLLLLGTKQARFGILLLPSIALMTAIGVDRWRVAAPAFVASAAFGLVQLWAITFGIDSLPKGRQVHAVTLTESFQLFSQRTHMEMGFRADPSGWGLAQPLGRLRGRIAVLDHAPDAASDPYRVAFLREGTLLQHLADRSRGRNPATVELIDCARPERLREFDWILVPFASGPGPLVSTRATKRCLEGLENDHTIPVIRTPDRDHGDFLGLDRVGVFKPASATVLRAHAVVPVPPSEAGLRIIAAEAAGTWSKVERVNVVLRNASATLRRGSLSFVIAPADKDPWTNARFVSPGIFVSVGPRGTLDVELSANVAPRSGEVVAVSLHADDPSKGELRGAHYAVVSLEPLLTPSSTPAAR